MLDEASIGLAGLEAKVLELLPNGTIRLELESRAQVIAHPVKAAEANFVRLRPNDKVLVALSVHDPGRGRILKLL